MNWIRQTQRFSQINRKIFLLGLLLFAFFIRTYHLSEQALRGDEAATVHYSAMPINELWELSRVTDPHPPLYYLILHPWQWLTGEAVWSMRFSGVIASLLGIAVLYRLAYRTLRRYDIAFFAAGLLAINPLQIWLAQDLRSYPFFTLFGLLSTYALWHALIHSEPRWKEWFSYVSLTVASLYIHYYAIFLIIFQVLFVSIHYHRFWVKKWFWLSSQLAIGLLIIPALNLAYNFIGQAAGGIETISMLDILRLASTALLTGFTIGEAWGLSLSIVLTPVWILGLLTLLRHNSIAGTFWSLFFAIPVLGVIALSINRPFFKERFLIQAQPAFELLLAVGFATLWRMGSQKSTFSPRYFLRLVASLLLIGLLYTNYLSINNYFANPAYAKSPPWHLYHDYVRDEAQPGDVMLTNFPEAAVSYYSPNELPFYVVPVERDRSLTFRLEETEKIAQAYQRIWFLPLLRQGFDEQGDVLAWLDRHADRVNQVFFPIYNINLYLTPPTIEKLMIPQPTAFEHGIHLRGYQIFDESGHSRLKADQTGNFLLRIKQKEKFTLSLYWQAETSTPTPYTVFTHLLASDGFLRAGHDNQPVWGTYPTHKWKSNEKITDKYTLTLPEGTPPGDHYLHIGWYNSQTLEPVPVTDTSSANDIRLNVIVRVVEEIE